MFCVIDSLANALVDSYNGTIPANYEKLLDICGVGDYIATAIMVFAFDERRVLVDNNVIKILEKEFEIISDKKDLEMIESCGLLLSHWLQRETLKNSIGA